jgi:uncharacterized protein (DUF2236 family)
VAELLELPRTRIPPTVDGLHAYIEQVVEGDDLRVTDASSRVADLFRHPPPDAEWKPVLRAVAWWAFGTLPARLRSMYGLRWGPLSEAHLRASLGALKLARPVIPRRLRWILPAQQAVARAHAA